MSIYHEDKIGSYLGLTALSNESLFLLEQEVNEILKNREKITCVYSQFRDDPTYDFKTHNIWNILKRNNDTLGIEKAKQTLREKTKTQFNDPIKRKKHLDSFLENDGNHTKKIWINKDGKNKRVSLELFNSNFSDWNKGRHIEQDNAFWNYDRTGANNPFYGKNHTDKTKQQISSTKRSKDK